MVWSAEGRPHPAAVRVMDCTVRQVRTRRGQEAADELQARWRHEIAVALQRRKAAMLRAVLPSRGPRQEWLARGGWLGPSTLPTLEEEEADQAERGEVGEGEGAGEERDEDRDAVEAEGNEVAARGVHGGRAGVV